jgi:hypothetical protein
MSGFVPVEIDAIETLMAEPGLEEPKSTTKPTPRPTAARSAPR